MNYSKIMSNYSIFYARKCSKPSVSMVVDGFHDRQQLYNQTSIFMCQQATEKCSEEAVAVTDNRSRNVFREDVPI